MVSAVSSGFAAPSFDGGTEQYGGADSVSVRKEMSAAADGVVMRKLSIPLTQVNPDYAKVARWDTSGINMYYLDMLSFTDTLYYNFKDANGQWTYTPPRQGMVTSGFGKRALFGRRFHKGLDIDLETGDPVVAALPGKVRIARYNRGYGNMVVICHEGGLETLYGHLSQLDVEEGQVVASGEQIGLGGSTGQSTGAHLHFEFRVFGEQVDPSWILDQHTLMPLTPMVRVDRSWFEHLIEMRDVEVHIVEVGQTVDQICAMYELDRATLLQLNDLDDDTVELAEGTRLKLD